MNTNKIISVVCDYYGVTQKEIISKSRKRNIVNARQVLSYLLRKNKLTYHYIGKLLSRNHSTIVQSCKVIEDLLQVDRNMVNDIKKIENFIT